jgi:hypothetical protein
MSHRILLRSTGLQTKRKVYRFLGYRQGRKQRGQKDQRMEHARLPALPYSRSAALESLLSVALSSARAARLYHSVSPSGGGRFFVVKMDGFSM